MSHQRTVDPTNEAVDYQEVMDHALVRNPAEAAYVRRLTKAAIKHVEDYLERGAHHADVGIETRWMVRSTLYAHGRNRRTGNHHSASADADYFVGVVHRSRWR